MQWNFTIQRQLATDTILRIGYVGSRAIHQPFRAEDGDIVLPILTPQGYLWPSPAGSGTRLNPNAGRITAGFWDGRSYYDALQVQLKKKIGRASQLAGSYTWGKTIDTSSGSMVGDEYTNSISSPLFFNLKLNRGLADFNVSHNLNINYTWVLGAPKWKSGISVWALGGWQLGGIFTMQSGFPFTVSVFGDTANAGAVLGENPIRANDTGQPLFGPDTRNTMQWFNPAAFSAPAAFTFGNTGRNTVYGPGLQTLDLALVRSVVVRESLHLELRAEGFNALNHSNFGTPNRFVNTPQFGTITEASTPGRELQLSARISF